MLEFRHVSRWYGDVIGVNDVDAFLRPGVTALLGPNGAGKSTLMRLAMGLLRPNQGELRVLGEDPWDNPGLLKRIGYVPEGPPPWRHLTGLECVERAALLSEMEPAGAHEAARDALAQTGMSPHAQTTVAKYSHGMQQRLKFALALVHNPELLILDEPLIGTDPLARRDLLAIIRRAAQEGRSAILSTHVLSDVEALTERILLLHHGRLMAHGDVHEIRDLLDRYPRTVRIATEAARQLGSELVHWDSVTGVEVEAGAVIVRTRQPAPFFAQLQAHLIERGVAFDSVTSPDDNVESVFRYIVGGEAAR